MHILYFYFFFFTYSVCSIAVANTSSTIFKRDESFLPSVTKDFPHILGYDRLRAWMDPSTDPCSNFYQYACGGFLKRYSGGSFKGSTVMKIMGKSNQLLMKNILSHHISPLASSSADEQEIFSKTREYYLSCENKREIEVRGFKPIIPMANAILEKCLSSISLPELFGHLQTNGIDVLFRSKFSKVETKDPKDLRLQFFPATAYDVSHEIILKVLRFFAINNVIPKATRGKELVAISKWVSKLERDNVKFVRKLNYLRHMSAFDKPDQFQTIDRLNELTDLDWDPLLNILDLPAGRKIHFWSGLNPWIDIFIKFDGLDRSKLQYYLLWRLATSHFSKLSRNFLEFWKNEIYAFAVKPDFPEIDSDIDIFQEDCVEETGKYLRYLSGHVFIQYAFNETQRANSAKLVDDLFVAFTNRIEEIDWLDPATKNEAMKKLKNIVRIIGYPDWLANAKEVVKRYKPLKLDPLKYFENAVQAQVFTKLTPAIEQSRHTTLDRSNIYFGFPWQLNAFHLTDLVLIQINSGVMQRPMFSELNPVAMNFGGIGSIIAHEITHGFDSIGSLLDSRGVRRHWMTDFSHHELYKRSKCFVKQYNQIKVRLPDGSVIRPNGKKSLPENMADNGGMFTSFRAMQNVLGPDIDVNQKLFVSDPFSPAQTFFISLGQSWCGEMDSNMVRYMVKNDVHSPNPARVHGSLSNSMEFAKAFNCPIGSPMVPNPPEKMCRAY